MATIRTDNDLEIIAHRASNAAKIIPNIVDDLAYRLATIDDRNYPESGQVRHIGDPKDPTGASAVKRSTVKAHTRRIRDAKKRLAAAMDDLDQTCRDALGRKLIDPTTEPVCQGGDPSNWGDPTCGELVELRRRPDGSTFYDPDGLCCDHRLRKEAFERRAAAALRQRQHRRRVTIGAGS